jgi:hypothetical protein
VGLRSSELPINSSRRPATSVPVTLQLASSAAAGLNTSRWTPLGMHQFSAFTSSSSHGPDVTATIGRCRGEPPDTALEMTAELAQRIHLSQWCWGAACGPALLPTTIIVVSTLHRNLGAANVTPAWGDHTGPCESPDESHSWEHGVEDLLRRSGSRVRRHADTLLRYPGPGHTGPH